MRVATDRSNAPTSADSVQWRFTTANSRPLRALSYLAVGLVVGPLLGFLAIVGSVVAQDDPGRLLLVVVLAVVVGLGVGSGRALFGLANAPPEVHETVRALSRRGVLGSVLTGAAVVLVGLRWTEVGLGVLVGCVGAGLGALVVGAGLQSEGAVDRAERTVEYGSHTVSVDAIRTVRSIRVGAVAVALVRYLPGRVGPSTPRVFVLSGDGLDAVESMRADGVRTDAVQSGESEELKSTPTAVRLVAGTFGVACVAVGPALWFVLPPGTGRLLAGYLGVFGLLFGALFLRYAVVTSGSV